MGYSYSRCWFFHSLNKYLSNTLIGHDTTLLALETQWCTGQKKDFCCYGGYSPVKGSGSKHKKDSVAELWWTKLSKDHGKKIRFYPWCK